MKFIESATNCLIVSVQRVCMRARVRVSCAAQEHAGHIDELVRICVCVYVCVRLCARTFVESVKPCAKRVATRPLGG